MLKCDIRLQFSHFLLLKLPRQISDLLPTKSVWICFGSLHEIHTVFNIWAIWLSSVDNFKVWLDGPLDHNENTGIGAPW